jgi:RNA polymerase sigma factor (sigma-70 family)
MPKGGGQEDRFRTAYESVRPRLLAYALRRTSSPEDAADVVAETFTIAWRRLDDVPPGDEAVLWFYATARKVLANHYRRARRHSELVDRLGAHLQGVVGSDDRAGPDRVAALAAFRRLDEIDRELLMLASWEGLNSAELARVLGCSRTAARLRLHRARSRLDAEMEPASELPTKHSAKPRHSLLETSPPKHGPEQA